MSVASDKRPLRIDEVARLCEGAIFADHLQRHVSVGSTSTLAMEAALAGAPEGLAIFAEEQTAGRGRGGHSWASVAGENLYFSVLLRPSLAADETLLIAMMAGLAVHAGVQEVCGVKADLRWPNDLLIGERKFCGILAEMATLGARVEAVVVGIGVNVNQRDFAPELRPIAGSLAEATGGAVSREELAAAILRALDGELKMLLAGGEARREIYRRFEERSSFARGAEVTVEELGDEHCRTAGLDDKGFLQVERADGRMHRVLHGGVRKR